MDPTGKSPLLLVPVLIGLLAIENDQNANLAPAAAAAAPAAATAVGIAAGTKSLMDGNYDQAAVCFACAALSGAAARGGAGPVASASREALGNEIGILREAASGRGNFGAGSADAATAQRPGAAWVGDGAIVASDGMTLLSRDGLRQFRPPSLKPRLGRVQANFEARAKPEGAWQSNAHLDITPEPPKP